jgi:RHS repeat-associated protein
VVAALSPLTVQPRKPAHGQAGVPHRYGYDAQRARASTGRDHLYSVGALTDSAGNVKERYAYSSYGARQTVVDDAAIVNDIGFTGRRLDQESGLWYFRSRNYDAKLGRFVQRDHWDYVDGYSMYEACFAPCSLDPYGYAAISPEDWESLKAWLNKLACSDDAERANRLNTEYGWTVGKVGDGWQSGDPYTDGKGQAVNIVNPDGSNRNPPAGYNGSMGGVAHVHPSQGGAAAFLSGADLMAAAKMAAFGNGRFVAAISFASNNVCAENCRFISIVSVDPDSISAGDIPGLQDKFDPTDELSGFGLGIGKYGEVGDAPPGTYQKGVHDYAQAIISNRSHEEWASRRDAMNNESIPGAASSAGAEQLRRLAEWAGIREVIRGAGPIKMQAELWKHCCEE